jgi:surface antigen
LEQHLPEKNTFRAFFKNLSKSKGTESVFSETKKKNQSNTAQKKQFGTFFKNPAHIVHAGILVLALSAVGLNVRSYANATQAQQDIFALPEDAHETPQQSIIAGLLNDKIQREIDNLNNIVESADSDSNAHFTPQNTTLASAGNQVALGNATLEQSNTQAPQEDVSPFAKVKIDEQLLADATPLNRENNAPATNPAAPEEAENNNNNQEQPEPVSAAKLAGSATAALPQEVKDQIIGTNETPKPIAIEPIQTKEKPVHSILATGGAIEKASAINPVEANANDLFIYHEIQVGETLSSIAAAYKLDEKTLLMESGLREDLFHTIKPGTSITVLPADGITHRVNNGDTLSSIVGRYGGNINQLQKDNDIITDNDLEIGQILFVRDGEKEIPKKPIDPPKPKPQPAQNRLAARNSAPGAYAPVANPTVSRGGVPNRFYKGQCTWYVHERTGGRITWRGNANAWAANARAQGYRVDRTPVTGAVVETYDGNRYYGHVGYIESVNGDGTLTISDMNYKGAYIKTVRTINMSNVKAVIHI